ncbi:MAG TPA: Sec-independent protein translocase subunit TatA [Actinomycetes bacterium]|nr:Sec-independent protein translocase subunit TatA [Actinomycetes bacterium]
MPQLGAPEIILIILAVLLLFGAKRLPDAARGLGRSLRIFKSEVKAAQDDDGNSPPQQIEAQPGEVTGQTPTTTTQPTQQPQSSTTPDTGSSDR